MIHVFGFTVRLCLLSSFLFSAIQAESLLDCDLHVSGNVRFDQQFENKGSSLLRDVIILQKESGSGTPYIDFKEASGTEKCRIYANTNAGEQGLVISRDGVNKDISIENDGSIFLNGPTSVDGDLQVAGDLVVMGNSQLETTNKASLFLSSNYTYTLGDAITFDQAFDPGSNVNGTPFAYIVPVSGFYIVTIRICASNLQTGESLTGTPVCELEVVRNSDKILTSFYPIASFGTDFKHSIAGVVRFTQGDSIYACYRMHSPMGPINGTVDLAGDVDGLSTYLTIHYLSTDVEIPL